MSNVIGFLESVGRDAVLRHASREQLLQAMRRGEIAAPLRADMLDAERAGMDALLGVREKVYCAIMPMKTPTPKKAPAKKPAKAPPKKAPAKKPAKKAPAKRKK